MSYSRRLSNSFFILGILIIVSGAIFSTSRSLWYLPAGLQLEQSPLCSPFNNFSATDNVASVLRSNLTVYDKPTNRYKDNLRSDRKYITSWGAAGWTNDFMAYVILIYMGMISDRIPIIPPFSRSHHIEGALAVYFGDIYDIEALSESIRWPILQWAEVKSHETGEEESLGCWSAWQLSEPEPRSSWAPFYLQLDISYTAAPSSASLHEGDRSQSVWGLTALGFEAGRIASTKQPTLPSPKQKVIPPDEHLFCLDYLFFAGIIRPKDMFDEEYSPGWRLIAKHAKFKPPLVRLATLRLEKHFGVARGGSLPPFITIHMRRGDFQSWCNDKIPADECYGSLPAYGVRVREVQAELLEKRGISVTQVLVTSDEDRESPLWDDIAAYGWGYIDHNVDATENYLGSWLPPVLDAVFHSMSIGFVGTGESTMSLMGRLRVEQWNGGVTRSVRWGMKDADDH